MQKNFNLLISCPRFHEKDAIAEVWYLYSNIADDEIVAELTGFPGLITAKTSLNPIDSIQNLKKFLGMDPSALRYVLKIIPIEIITETILENLIQIAGDLGKQISQNETFRITVKGRQSPLESQAVIIKLAEHIDRKVNLNQPDRIVMIQILGDITGISLLRPNDILIKAHFSY